MGSTKPRAGSLAFYPRKRAKREFASYQTVSVVQEAGKPLNFLGYKAGMTHVIGKNLHSGSPTFSQDVFIPVTVLECPPLIVFGIRAYQQTTSGLKVLGEAYAGKTEKDLQKKITNFRNKSKKEKKKQKQEKKQTVISDLESMIDSVSEFRLLVHSQPRLAGIGKKKPEVFEMHVSGNKEQQLAFAKEKLGKDIVVKDCFQEKQSVDARAVTKGHGFSGVVKRFGVRMHGPKAKKRRVVGSIGPWNPSTVMWTVARPGQLGYQTRTIYNNRILFVGEEGKRINLESGFKNYGLVKSDFVLLAGSIPGPAKRAIALRHAIRNFPEQRHNIESIAFIAGVAGKKGHATEEEAKAVHVEHAKEEKQEKKTVEQEIAEAAKK